MLGAPHLLEIVEGANLGPENVDDHIAGIDHHPIAMRQTFDLQMLEAERLQSLEDMIGDRPDMSVGPSACNDHDVGEGGFPGEIDADDVLGLVLIEAVADRVCNRAGG